MRFLIVRLSSLGDVVCSLPVADVLRSTFPEAHIAWAVDPRFSGIVECCVAVDEVIEVKPKFAPKTWPTFESPFEAVLDVQGLSKSAIVAVKATSTIKLGFHWQREGAWLTTRPVQPDPTSLHVVDQYADVARAAVACLGGKAEGEYGFALKPREVDIASVQVKLNALSVNKSYVVINPGAGWVTKRWPPEHFAKVADWLFEKGHSAVAIGGNAPADHAAYDEVAACAQHPPIKLTGATSVRELVALLANTRAHIGGDTGSSHLAAALGIPAIGLYSITRPIRSCPYGQIETCLYDPDGLDRIMPGSVIHMLDRILFDPLSGDH